LPALPTHSPLPAPIPETARPMPTLPADPCEYFFVRVLSYLCLPQFASSGTVYAGRMKPVCLPSCGNARFSSGPRVTKRLSLCLTPLSNSFCPIGLEVFTFFSFKTWMDSIQFLSFRPSFRIFAFALCSAPHFPRGCLAESALSGCYLRISGGASAELAFFLRL